MYHILVVDDDDKLRNLLARYLQEHNMRITTCENAVATRRVLVGNSSFDCAIVDVMMPDEDGLTLTSYIKEHHSSIPIILLTALGEADDRVQGLESGADDYLVKPFEPRELLLRIEKLISLYHKLPEIREDIVPFGDYRFNTTTGILHHSATNDPIYLTSGEITILTLLSHSPNTPLPRETFSQHMNNISERSIDVQINRLRQKIEPNPKEPVFLHTVRNQGYLLRTS